MKENVTRRQFLSVAGTAAVASAVTTGISRAAAEPSEGKKIKIIGVSCSARKGMNTAKSVQLALDAAKAFDPRIEVELIDLGELNIAGWSPKVPQDDFASIQPKLQDPSLGGLIIGSPSYYRSMSALCKAFIERCTPLREPKMLLANKPVGVLAVGGFRNGGQEMTIEQIQAAMLCFGMVVAGGNPPAFQGGTIVAPKEGQPLDDLSVDTAKKLGAHVAELALRLAPKE